MAAKNKFRKKQKATKKVTFEAKDEEAGNSSGDEEEKEEESADDGGENSTRRKEEEEFNLEEVLRLGGTQADFILLASLDDGNELVDGGKKGAIDDLEEGELEAFINKLGIRALAEQHHVIADEPEAAAAGLITEKPEAEQEVKKTKEKPESSQQKLPEPKKKKDKDAQKTSGRKQAKLNASVFEFRPRQQLLVKPGGKWFHLEYAAESTAAPQDPELVSRYKALAQQLLEAEVSLYKNKKSLQRGANSGWMKTVVTAGVLADRMAAMTLLVQDAPVHMVEHVEALVAMVKKKGGRRMGLMALDTLRELLLSDLLPEDRKLRPFAERPFDQLEEKASGNRDARDRRLILWYFEHRLKHHVAEFVAALEEVGRDTVVAAKTKALAAAHELLCSRPEQERALLAQIVNKLGDPDHKMAAKASHLLETLLRRHPNMKATVCCEVERLVFRPNVGAKAQYYAVCFLAQVLLSHADAALATRLIAVYFSFFRACVKKKDVQSKMLSALLTGVNRAYPYAAAADNTVKEQLDTLFKVAHLAKFNTAVQALMLLFQVMDAEQSVSDRFYGALYRKLLDPGLSSSSRHSMFLNLLYKSIKADVVQRRVVALVKRLLQVSQDQSSGFACGSLMLLSELMKTRGPLKLLLLQEGGDEDEETFKDLSEDQEEEKKEEEKEEDEDDDEERFVDADKQEASTSKVKAAASWVHHQNLEGVTGQQKYDPLNRNPLYCGAENTRLWELHRLSMHFHPSVALFAKTILQGDPLLYCSDPLQDFTLMRFLDRFVFRNPKKEQQGKQNTDSQVLKHRKAAASLPVNCEEFLSKDESQIPVDEIFFYRFFKKRQQQKTIRRRRDDGDDDSVEDVDDDEFEKILDSCESDAFFTDAAEDQLDFAGNVRTKKKGQKDSDDSDSDVSDLDDEEVSLSLDEDDFDLEDVDETGEGGGGGTFMDVDEDDDEEIPELEDDDDAAFDSDEDKVPEIKPQTKKRKSSEQLPSGSKQQQKKKKRGNKDAAVFASAEEFGSLLDENSGSKFDNIGLNAVENKDKAGLKQLQWESRRDDWMRGRDVQTLRRKKTRFGRKFQGRMSGNRKRK